MNPLFLCRVKTQFDNLGDALINRELLKICADRGSVTVCIDAVPDGFLGWLRLGSIPGLRVVDSKWAFYGHFFAAIVQSFFLRRKVFFVQNPGGYIGEISAKILFSRKLKSWFLIALRALGVNSVLIGASYEGLGKNNLIGVRQLSKVLTVHAVRDNDSRVYCEKNGIRVSGVLPDLAFNLDSNFSLMKRERKCIVSVRDAKDSDYSNALVAMLLNAYRSGGFDRVVLVYQVRRDSQFMEKFQIELVAAGIPTDNAIVPLVGGIEENLAFYSSAEFVVSNRLHVLLLAWRAGAQPVAVIKGGENKKIVGIYEDAGLGLYCLRSDSGPDVLAKLMTQRAEEGPLPRLTEGFDALGGRLRAGFENMLRA